MPHYSHLPRVGPANLYSLLEKKHTQTKEQALSCITDFQLSELVGGHAKHIVLNGNGYQAQEIGALGLANSSRARDLFALGPAFALGSLFKATLAFSEAVSEPVKEKIAQSMSVKPHLIIGVQVRHRNPIHNGTHSVSTFSRAVKQVLNQRKNASCAVYLASDRKSLIELLELAMVDLGCTTLTTSSLQPTKSNAPAVKNWGENYGFGSMHDLFLLSHVDVLITSYGSTCMFVQELIAAQHEGVTVPLVILCDYVLDACLPELPLIYVRNAPYWWSSLVGWPNEVPALRLISQPRHQGC